MANAKKKPAATKTQETMPVGPVPAELKQFSNGAGVHPGFSFTRYWWDGDGPRAGIADWVRKKQRPGEDPIFGHAAKVEVLVPRETPGEYALLDFLLRRFDETLPPFERHAFIQVKIALDPAKAWHAEYERVRVYAKGHFVAAGHPVILVAHVPAIAGLEGYGSHVHCIALARRLGINGLGGACTRLCSDQGHTEAWTAYGAALTEEPR